MRKIASPKIAYNLPIYKCFFRLNYVYRFVIRSVIACYLSNAK